ncbi:MAG: hypothetical protein WA418_26640, partial [Bradyrhizobium sp.]
VIARSPACHPSSPGYGRAAKAVVKMSVTSSETRAPEKGSNSIAYSPPNQSTSRGEDDCYFDC